MQPKRRSPRLWMRLADWSLRLLALLSLAGCASQTGTAVTVRGDTFCAIARPITWATADTPATIDQVRRHNAQHGRVCGGKR